MTARSKRPICLLFVVLVVSSWFPCSAPSVQAQDPRAEAEKAARAAMDEYFRAWNTGDNVEVRKTLNFPFVTMGRNGAMIVDATPEEYTTDFERMRTREGWAKSTLEKLDAEYVTADRVHFHVTFGRFHPDGSQYMTGHMLYIVTRKDGHWGPQFRTSIAPPRQPTAR